MAAAVGLAGRVSPGRQVKQSNASAAGPRKTAGWCGKLKNTCANSRVFSRHDPVCGLVCTLSGPHATSQNRAGDGYGRAIDRVLFGFSIPSNTLPGCAELIALGEGEPPHMPDETACDFVRQIRVGVRENRDQPSGRHVPVGAVPRAQSPLCFGSCAGAECAAAPQAGRCIRGKQMRWKIKQIT